MANLFDFHLVPEPVEHMAVLLTDVKCVPGRAAACSLRPLWSGERSSSLRARAATSLAAPCLWYLSHPGGSNALVQLLCRRPCEHIGMCLRQASNVAMNSGVNSQKSKSKLLIAAWVLFKSL